MKTSILDREGISQEVVEVISHLVHLIPWPERRRAMGEVTLRLLDGKHRVSENVFGWNRSTIQMGLHEFQSGILCINDLSNRHRPKVEETDPQLLSDIQEIMDPHSEAEPRLRTTLLYTNITAQTVYNALLEKGWTSNTLPSVRTVSNILNRHNYRLRTVAKTKVQKKQKKPTRFSKTYGR